MEALLASVLQPGVDPEPLVMNATPSNMDWSEENDDVTPQDMDVDMDSADDPVDAALERDLQRWQEQRDCTPSPPPSMSSAPDPQLGPTSKEPGVIKLYCSKWFKAESGGHRGCWFSQPFPRERFSELGMVHKQKYQDLRLAMKRNARRPGAE